MGAQQCEHDPLVTEAEAGGVGHAAIRELDPVRAPEVVLVVIERGEGRRLGSRDLNQQLELQRPLALIRREHAAAAAEEVVELDPMTVLTGERDEYLLALQRTQADFENYRKRATREAAAAQVRGVIKLLLDHAGDGLTDDVLLVVGEQIPV